MTSIDFSKKSFVVITGASRGIGRTIAIEISRKLEQNSILILLARSIGGLEETKAQIAEVDKSITVQTYSVDFAKPNIEEYNQLFRTILGSLNASGIEYGIIFHNAGHIGTLKKTRELTDLASWREHFEINFYAPLLLNSAFINTIQPITKKLCVINISSLVGKIPYENFGMYGSSKASREHFFKILAKEEPDIIVFNYSPGPVDTDMFNSILDPTVPDNTRNMFEEVKKTTLLSPTVTVDKMLGILEKGSFRTGDSIDYYDKE